MPSHAVSLETFLSKGFRPEIHANNLLKETTTPQDPKADTSSALARLKYDIEEIDDRLDNICRENANELLKHAQRTESVAEHVESLRPVLDEVNVTMNKLDRDFLGPYNRATELHSALTNLHKAAVTSRYLSWYLQLALQAQSQDYKREIVNSTSGPGTAMLRNAYALKTLANLVTEAPELLKVGAVQSFQTKIPQFRSELIDEATNQIQAFDGLVPGQAKLAAMVIMSLDADLAGLISTHTKALVGTTVLQLSRNGGSPIAHESAFADAQKRAEVVKILGSVRDEVLSKTKSENTVLGNALDDFWNAVAAQLELKLKTMEVTNQVAIKAMISNKASILSCTQTVPQVYSVFQKYVNK